jgi:ferric iron reductase protein FhuF
MFPIRAKTMLPVERIIIESVAVRGQLGDMSVWISNIDSTEPSPSNDVTTADESNRMTSIRLTAKYWTKIYQQKHKPSPRSYATLDLSSTSSEYYTPVVLLPGQVRIMYIHSTLESDAGNFIYVFM